MEEAREEDEVAGVHGNWKFNVGRRNVTSGMTGLLEEAVRPNIDCTADDHLSQLKRGDNHGDEAWWMEFESAQSVISVHQRVNTIIHNHEPASWRGIFGVGEPTVHQHRDVVVPVQEDERLFAQHNEDRVTKLGQLWQHKKPCPEAAHLVVLNVAEMEKILTLVLIIFECRMKVS